jgi:site-specific DNA recombinase
MCVASPRARRAVWLVLTTRPGYCRIRTQVKYCLCARKRTESENRQVQSIDDQLSRLRERATSLGLPFVRSSLRPRRQSRRRTPGVRRDDQTRRTGRSFCAALLGTEPPNAQPDSGQISCLLQNCVLRSIQTYQRGYLPQDNVLLFSVETGMANQYVLDLSRNVKRGIKGKLERGELPCMAPTNYLNDPATRTIIPDPERFPLHRRVWDMMLSENYGVSCVLDKLNNARGFRTFKRRKVGGNPLALSALYKILHNPFYTGMVVANRQSCPGKHEPMVTLSELEQVQHLISKEDKPRPSKRYFSFSRLITCGEGGCAITAEDHWKTVRGQERKNCTSTTTARSAGRITAAHREAI